MLTFLMSRFSLPVLLAFVLNLAFCMAGRGAEITGLRAVSPGQVELTFTSETGVLYDILGSEDLRTFSILTRVTGSGELTQVVVPAPQGQLECRSGQPCRNKNCRRSCRTRGERALRGEVSTVYPGTNEKRPL